MVKTRRGIFYKRLLTRLYNDEYFTIPYCAKLKREKALFLKNLQKRHSELPNLVMSNRASQNEIDELNTGTSELVSIEKENQLVLCSDQSVNG